MMKFESAFVHSVILIYQVINFKIIFINDIFLPQPKLNTNFQTKMKDGQHLNLSYY